MACAVGGEPEAGGAAPTGKVWKGAHYSSGLGPNGLEFLIQWQGCVEEHNSWEPEVLLHTPYPPASTRVTVALAGITELSGAGGEVSGVTGARAQRIACSTHGSERGASVSIFQHDGGPHTCVG